MCKYNNNKDDSVFPKLMILDTDPLWCNDNNFNLITCPNIPFSSTIKYIYNQFNNLIFTFQYTFFINFIILLYLVI